MTTIQRIQSLSYSHIGQTANARTTRQTDAHESHGLWQEDLRQDIQSARQDVRQQSLPVMAEVYQSQQLNTLFDIYTDQSTKNVISMHNALAYEQKLERNARNTVLLQAYQDHQSVQPVGQQIAIAA